MTAKMILKAVHVHSKHNVMSQLERLFTTEPSRN